MDLQNLKTELRNNKIRARESLSEAERISKSYDICRNIMKTREYAEAKTIFAYKWVRGEVRLDDLEDAACRDGKRLVYPVCISRTEMIAVEPGRGEGAWKAGGAFGISEPDPEKGRVIAPAEIDLVICPCSSFDEEGGRLGMGGGYYDRYLPECINAHVAAVAYEVQKADEIPADEYDVRVDAVISEDRIYISI